MQMKKILAKDFSLEHTIDSGQIFRYEKKDEFYFIVKQDIIIKIMQKGNFLYYKASKKASEQFIRDFFGLNDDLSKILLEIDKDKLMNKAIAKYQGLRIMNQNPEECLASFIASAFSNIPKIKRSLNLIAKNFGRKIRLDDYETYSFPKLNDLNDLYKLKKCSLGFRAERIYNLRNLDDDFFKKVQKLNYLDAKKELMGLKGVGSKVADCVLLFSLKHYESFPTDVWVERIIKRNYLKKRKTNIKKVEEFGRKYFGKYAGYAQQYLYHYVRNL
jgi:N-glycosylase/DNA lyase